MEITKGTKEVRPLPQNRKPYDREPNSGFSATIGDKEKLLKRHRGKKKGVKRRKRRSGRGKEEGEG
jgi:hypothetical protein